MKKIYDGVRYKLFVWIICCSAFIVYVGASQLAYGQQDDLCAVCLISKTEKKVCYINSHGANDTHELGHILNACGIHPCVRAVDIISKEEAKKQGIPVKDVKHMSKVECD